MTKSGDKMKKLLIVFVLVLFSQFVLADAQEIGIKNGKVKMYDCTLLFATIITADGYEVVSYNMKMHIYTIYSMCHNNAGSTGVQQFKDGWGMSEKQSIAAYKLTCRLWKNIQNGKILYVAKSNTKANYAADMKLAKALEKCK